MWIPGIASLSIVLLLLLLVSVRRSASRRRSSASARTANPDIKARASSGSSIIQKSTVQRSLSAGAPPTPWLLGREDRQAMGMIETFFARAIPTPGDGRPFVQETVGEGGPQLELYVPILSSRSPIAVAARSWDAGAQRLVSNLFIFGAVKGRLADVVSKTGFELAVSSDEDGFTVFRNSRGIAQQRSA